MNDLVERLREPVTPRIYSLDVASMRLAAAYIEELEAEVEEQCRLNGMGAEREARLLARVEELERVARMALEALIYCEALNSDVERQKIEAVNDLREMLGEKK